MGDPSPHEPTQPIAPSAPSPSRATEPTPTVGDEQASSVPPAATPPPPIRRRAWQETGGSLGTVGAVVAGILLVIAPFFPWLTLTVNVPGRTFKGARLRGVDLPGTTGLHLPDGRVVLALGVAILVVGLAGMAGGSQRLRGAVAVALLAAGTVAATLAIAVLAIRPEVPGLAQISQLLSRGGGRIAGLLDRVGVSKGSGLWIALIGGLLAVAAGVAEIMRPFARMELNPRWLGSPSHGPRGRNARP